MSQKDVYFYLPHSIAENLEEIIISTGELNLAKYHIDKVRYVIDKIYRSHLTPYKKHKNSPYKKYKNSFIPLNRKILESLIGKKYVSSILFWLMKNEILERDARGYSTVSHESYRYRLTDKYRNEIHRLVWSSDTRFARKITKYRESKERELEGLDKRLKRTLESIEIDYSSAMNYCLNALLESYEMVYRGDISTVPLCTPSLIERIEHQYHISLKSADRGRKKQKSSDYNFQKFLSDIYSIDRIRNKHFTYIVDKKSSRRHTNITNLRRALRQFITIDGKPLIEFDIRNSQPLIFAANLLSYFKMRHLPLPIDVLLFKQECEQGIFYERLMEIAEVPEIERSSFKEKFFGNVFFNETPRYKNKHVELFKTKFPNVWLAIVDLKKKKYSDLSINLQKKEVEIIIKKAVKGIYSTHPTINLLTIHDSICFTDFERAESIKTEILNAFFRFNLTPTIITNYYSPDLAQELKVAA